MSQKSLAMQAAICLESLRVGNRQAFLSATEQLRGSGVTVKNSWLTAGTPNTQPDKRFADASQGFESLLTALSAGDARTLKQAVHKLKHNAGLTVTVG
jgi:hypothetical protein